MFLGRMIENGKINAVCVQWDGTWREVEISTPTYGGAICEHPSMYLSYINEQTSQYLLKSSVITSYYG